MLATDPRALGRRPPDLAELLTDLALGSPAILAARSLSGGASVGDDARRRLGALIAEAFWRLSNWPAVIALLRQLAPATAARDEAAYWRLVLRYCRQGNLQAVLDEQWHMLWDQESWSEDADADETAAKCARKLVQVVHPARARVHGQFFRAEQGASGGSVERERLRVRTVFALRFGHIRTDEGEVVSQDAVRAASRHQRWSPSGGGARPGVRAPGGSPVRVRGGSSRPRVGSAREQESRGGDEHLEDLSRRRARPGEGERSLGVSRHSGASLHAVREPAGRRHDRRVPRVVPGPKAKAYRDALADEARLLRYLQPWVEVGIPDYVYQSADGSFAGYPILVGRELDAATFGRLSADKRGRIADQLAAFLTALHETPKSVARECGVSEQDPQQDHEDLVRNVEALVLPRLAPHEAHVVRAFLAELATELAPACRTALVHGDLSGEHILWYAEKQRVSVIDFSDRSIGDPALDFAGLPAYGQEFAEHVVGRYRGPKEAGTLRRARLYFRRGALETMADALQGYPCTFEDGHAQFRVRFEW